MDECSWVFADLGGRVNVALCALGKALIYEKGEVIFQEGEPAFGLYVVCEGKVKLAKHSRHGKQQILKLLGPRELLGEKTMFDRGVYTAYAQTLERTRVKFFERDQFLTFLKEHPEVELRLIEKLSRELGGFEDKLIETAYESAQGRLARLLLMIAEKFGRPEKHRTYIGIDLARQELAEFAGISTETAIRTFSRFKTRGLVELDGHKVYIIDKDGLTAMVEHFPTPLKENIL
jgi:CRP/FNR family transcriptional regulator